MYVEAYNLKKKMKEFLKEIKETSTAEKFWTSLLLLLWIGILCYSFITFAVLQVLFFIFITFLVWGDEIEEKNDKPFLWLFTSIFVIIMFLIAVLTDKIEKSIKINPIKKFNDWLNKF